MCLKLGEITRIEEYRVTPPQFLPLFAFLSSIYLPFSIYLSLSVMKNKKDGEECTSGNFSNSRIPNVVYKFERRAANRRASETKNVKTELY